MRLSVRLVFVLVVVLNIYLFLMCFSAQMDANQSATFQSQGADMVEFFAVSEGDYGRVEVVEHHHDLVMHAHTHTHFAFWLGGGLAHARVGPDVVQLGADMALGVNSHASHDLRLNDLGQPAVFLNLYLNDDWLDAQCSTLAHSMVLPQSAIGITAEVRAVSSVLLAHMVSPLREQSLCLADDVASLVSKTICSAMTPEQLQAMPLRRRMIDYRLRLAIAHMQANLGNPKVAEEVAEVVGLSRSRFFELFHDQLGTSPLVFWNAMRVEEALTRLNAHEENMTSLSMSLGFSTPGNFSRFFRDHRGMTPTAYRRVSHAF
jgi:AraC-like DNA-binding protein